MTRGVDFASSANGQNADVLNQALDTHTCRIAPAGFLLRAGQPRHAMAKCRPAAVQVGPAGGADTSPATLLLASRQELYRRVRPPL
jgi:hypothetical protein